MKNILPRESFTKCGKEATLFKKNKIEHISGSKV